MSGLELVLGALMCVSAGGAIENWAERRRRRCPNCKGKGLVPMGVDDEDTTVQCGACEGRGTR